MSGIAAYHGLDAATHQQRVNDLAAAGLRPLALDVSGDPVDPRYAAVWLERPGPPWKAVQDLSSNEYQARFEELTGQGYALTIVTATGPVGSERYAAVFERGVHPPWFARHRLRWDPATSPDTITHQNNRAFDEGYIPRCLTVYGDPSDRRFAGVWVKNTDAVLWSWWFAGPDLHRRLSDALASGGMRPAALSVATDGAMLSVSGGSGRRLAFTAGPDRGRISGGVRQARGRRPPADRPRGWRGWRSGALPGRRRGHRPGRGRGRCP
jgi:hypothetical protein